MGKLKEAFLFLFWGEETRDYNLNPPHRNELGFPNGALSQTFDIFEYDEFWLIHVDVIQHMQKNRPATTRVTKSLSQALYGKRLAWETSHINIVVQAFVVSVLDICVDFALRWEVSLDGNSSKLVIIATEIVLEFDLRVPKRLNWSLHARTVRANGDCRHGASESYAVRIGMSGS